MFTPRNTVVLRLPYIGEQPIPECSSVAALQHSPNIYKPRFGLGIIKKKDEPGMV